jgi:twitching motility protein PilT
VEGIDTLILTGRADGMVTFDESVRQLLRAGRISRSVAEQNATDPQILFR